MAHLKAPLNRKADDRKAQQACSTSSQGTHSYGETNAKEKNNTSQEREPFVHDSQLLYVTTQGFLSSQSMMVPPL